MDYDKIWSLKNKANMSNRQLAQLLGMSGQGFKTMMEKESCTVKTLEKLSEIFHVPIIFFLDKRHELFESEENTASEPIAAYGKCMQCAKKSEEINDLRAKLYDTQNKYTDLLEEFTRKKGNNKQCG